MPKPTLADVFPGATQTATEIIIPKAALRKLTPKAVNTGGGICSGFVDEMTDFFTPTRRGGDSNAVPAVPADLDVPIIAELGRVSTDTNYDDNNNPIYSDVQEVVVSFFRPRAGANFDPDDYE